MSLRIVLRYSPLIANVWSNILSVEIGFRRHTYKKCPVFDWFLRQCSVYRVLDIGEMAQQKPTFDYHEETQGERLARKSKESPFMVFGIAGLAAAVGYGVYSYRNRGKMSTSVYLMQFRVISQGIAVGAITVGMAYTLYNNHFNKPKKNAITEHVMPKANEH